MGGMEKGGKGKGMNKGINMCYMYMNQLHARNTNIFLLQKYTNKKNGYVGGRILGWTHGGYLYLKISKSEGLKDQSADIVLVQGV